LCAHLLGSPLLRACICVRLCVLQVRKKMNRSRREKIRDWLVGKVGGIFKRVRRCTRAVAHTRTPHAYTHVNPTQHDTT
jgi:hypothetical protein